MTLFVPEGGADAGAARWRAAAASSDATVELAEVGAESWATLQGLPGAASAGGLRALLVRPDGHIWRRGAGAGAGGGGDEPQLLAQALAAPPGGG